MPRNLIGSFVVWAVIAPAIWAAESYEVRIREREKGDSYTVEETDKLSIKAVFLDSEKKETAAFDAELVKAFKQPDQPEQCVFVETVVEASKEFTKLRRHYQSGKVAEEGKLIDHPLAGKTVIIELRGDKRSFYEEDGAELLGKDAERLANEFDSFSNAPEFKDWLPKHQVAVGEKWSIEPQTFVKLLSEIGGTRDFQVDVDTDAATASATLNRVYQKKGTNYGVIEFTFRIPLNAFMGSKDLASRPKEKLSVLEAVLTFDGAIDGSLAPGQFLWKMNFDAKVPLSFADITEDADEDALIGYVSMLIKGECHRKWHP